MSNAQNSHADTAQDDYNHTTGERQVEAALAVAYEQRTANMLALYTAGGLWRSAVLRAEFGYEIKKRLGVEKEA